MDANPPKAQLPSEDWPGWTGLKLVEKWAELRGPLSVCKARVSKTGENDPNNIPEFSRGSGSVPAKVVW